MSVPKLPPPEGGQEQSILEHLGALRACLINSILYIFAGFCLAYFFSDRIFDFIREPISPYLKTSAGGLIFTGVVDKFVAHLKVSFLAGLVITTPFWLYEVWKFVAPGLYSHEKKYAISFITIGSILFMSGVAFLYYLVLPAAFKFLLNYGGNTDQAMITIHDYLSFFMTSTLMFGVAFELPLILVILGMLGVITDEFLIKHRRYAIVILAAVSAVITPPDVLSMIIMLVPLVLFYEISIILVRILGRKSA